MRGRAGFTLVELMVAVAIIGILAAIAAPAYLRYNYRARTAELPANLNAMRESATSYYAAAGTYPTLAASPVACAGGSAPASSASCRYATFDADGSDVDFVGFSGLGWIPVGPLWGQYALTGGCLVNGRNHCFTAEAKADIDGDGQPQVWEFAHPQLFTGLFAGGTAFGGANPPLDESANPQVDVVARDFTMGLY